MPWRPLPRIAFAVATYPFQPTSPSDLPLELGDELYVIEQGGKNEAWYRGYLVAPPSLLAGLTSVKGQTLEARVFSGIFPRACVEVREELGDADMANSRPNGRADTLKQNGRVRDGLRSPDGTPSKINRGETRKSLELLTNKRHSRLKDHRLSRAPDMQADRADLNNAKPPAPVPMLKIGDETPTSVQEPLVDEIASCLREWHSTNLHELLLTRQYGSLDKMSGLVSQLDLARRQLLHNVLTVQERDRVREQTTWALVKANKMLSGEVIVRDPAQRGRLLTGEDSAIEMTRLQSVLSLLESGQTAQTEGLALHHLLLEVKDVIGADIDGINITMSLCLKSEDGHFTPLSETFALNLPSSESLANMARSSKLKTLFRDLSAGDVGVGPTAQNQQLFLVVKVKESQAPRPRTTRKNRPAGKADSLSEGPYVAPYLRNFNPQGTTKAEEKPAHVPIYLKNFDANANNPLNAGQKKEEETTKHVPVYLRNFNPQGESGNSSWDSTPRRSDTKREPHVPIYLKNFNPQESNPLDAGQKKTEDQPKHVPVYLRNFNPETIGGVNKPATGPKKEPHVPIYLKNFDASAHNPLNQGQKKQEEKPKHVPIYLKNFDPNANNPLDQGQKKQEEKQTYAPVYLKNFGGARPSSADGGGGRRSLLGSRRSRASSRESARSAMKQDSPQPVAERKVEAPRTVPTGPPVVRTVGAGLIDLSSWMAQDKAAEKVISIWSVAENDDDEDEAFDKSIVSIFPSPTGRYKRSPKASQILVQLNPFVAPDAGALMRNNPTLMHMVQQTHKVGFSEAPTKPRSDIYLTFSQANISRDAYLSHPESGRVQLPGASGMQNLQLTMEVRDGLGKRIEHCIFPSSNSTGFTAWRTTVTEVGTPWDQTICLKIAKHQVPGSHLIMSIADAPEFPFALGWMPLWDDQAFVKDGPHRLVLHSYDKTTSSIVNGKGAYLSLAWDSAEKTSVSKDETVTGSVSTLSMRSYLCSTEYSQDHIILGLINWKQQTSAQLMDLLKQMVFVPEIEIVKQLADVFDALFAIVVHKSGEAEYEDIVFNDLVTILSIGSDRRFSINPLVDDYAENRFDFPFATSCLMRSYARLLENATAPQQARNLRAAFKVGQHLLKFIIIARDQQKLKEEGIGIHGIQKNFALEMQSIFRALESLMLNPNAVLVGSKTLLVQHFHGWLLELREAFSKREVIEIAFRFLDACKDVKGRLVLFKIILALNLAKVEGLFLNPADRQSLIKNAYAWLAPYWGSTHDVNDQWKAQVRLCTSVVAELLRFPSSEIYIFMPKVVASYCAIATGQKHEHDALSLLFPKAYPFVSKPTSVGRQEFDEPLLELAALMSAIARIPPPSTIRLTNAELSSYILSTLKAQRSILEYEAYPVSWLSLNIYHHRSAMQSLEYMYDLLAKSFLPPAEQADDFDMELWKTFFSTLLKLVSSGTLALETFPEQKRRTVWKIAGDVREQGAALLRRCWEAIGWDTSPDDVRRYNLNRLGGYQVQYVPSLVGPIVELCLSVHEGLRRVAVEILQTMIVSEWALSEDLALIETEVIGSLDLIFKTRKINESDTQKLFVGELLDLFEPIASQPDDALWIALKELVTSVDELMDLLIAAHGDSVESNIHTLRLMEFMKDMHKEDIFVRYVHELADLQENARNPTEAGLALQCHADIYAWDPVKVLPAMRTPAYPEQTCFARKEALYFRMIELYEDGRAWNLALANYQELSHRYERTVFDYTKLARAQRSMAKISDTVAREERDYSRYFRVSYRGLGFPISIRDKSYVHEGSPSDRMATFTDRLLKQYPNASISQFPETEDIEGQYLQVVNVSPYRDLNHPIYQRALVPPAVREHLLVSMPHQFSVTSKRAAHGVGVKEQVVGKTIYSTAEPFPNLLRRSEITRTEEVRLTPIQTAIERIWRKTSDLLVLEKRAIKKQDSDNEALTECLTQLLDLHSVHGTCLATYQQLIPDPDEKIEDEDEEGESATKAVDPLVTALEIALTEHAATIKRCLRLYEGSSLQAAREDLNELFEQSYPEMARLPAEQQLPDLPISTVDADTRRNSEDQPQRRSGFGSERPVSALITRLSSTLNKNRNADLLNVNSSHSVVNTRQTPAGDRNASNRLSLNFMRNKKDAVALDQVHEPGSKRVEVKPRPDRNQPKDISLRGGYDQGMRDDVSSPTTPGADGVKEAPKNASFFKQQSRASSSALGTSLSDHPEARRRFSHERVRPRDRNTGNRDNTKRQSLIGSVIGSLIGGRRPSNASASVPESDLDGGPFVPTKKDAPKDDPFADTPPLRQSEDSSNKVMHDTPGSFPDTSAISRIQRESQAFGNAGPSRILTGAAQTQTQTQTTSKPPFSPPSLPLPQPPEQSTTLSQPFSTDPNPARGAMSKRVREMQLEREEVAAAGGSNPPVNAPPQTPAPATRPSTAPSPPTTTDTLNRSLSKRLRDRTLEAERASARDRTTRERERERDSVVYFQRDLGRERDRESRGPSRGASPTFDTSAGAAGGTSGYNANTSTAAVRRLGLGGFGESSSSSQPVGPSPSQNQGMKRSSGLESLTFAAERERARERERERGTTTIGVEGKGKAREGDDILDPERADMIGTGVGEPGKDGAGGGVGGKAKGGGTTDMWGNKRPGPDEKAGGATGDGKGGNGKAAIMSGGIGEGSDNEGNGAEGALPSFGPR